MIAVLEKLASLRLTMAGIAGVVVMSIAINRLAGFTAGWVAVPLAILSFNLVAAILVNPAFRRQPALLAFHVCLLVVVLLLGSGVLVRFEGRVEIAEGERFDPANVSVTERGILHSGSLSAIDFVQGAIEVDYRPGLLRQHTRSVIRARDPAGRAHEIALGDRVSATFGNYRFVSTMNKGYAAIVSWTGAGGESIYGSINFPSYPEFEWKQLQTWTTPTGQTVEIELALNDAARRDRDWTLTRPSFAAPVILRAGSGGELRLAPGDHVALRGGVMGIESVSLWMGYRIDYNPLLPWTLAAAMMALIALAMYFQVKYWAVRHTLGQAAGLERA